MSALTAHVIIAVVGTVALTVLMVTNKMDPSVGIPILTGLLGSLGGHSVAKAGYANAK